MDHSDNVRILAAIPTKLEVKDAIERCHIDATDAEILRRRYIDHQDLGFIADTVWLSYSATVRRHKRAVSMLAKMLQSSDQKTPN